MTFTTDDKIRAVASFVVMLRDTAGCTPAEIKRLLDPRMLDGILAITDKAQS